MDVLSNELLLKIFGHCDQDTLLKLSSLCRKTRSLLKENTKTIRGCLRVFTLRIHFNNKGVTLLRKRYLPAGEKPIWDLSECDSRRLEDTKTIEWSDETAQLIWNHIWYLEPTRISIRIEDKRYTDILEKMPDSWLARASEFSLDTSIPCDIISILRKLKECSQFNFEVSNNVLDVNEMLTAVTKVRSFMFSGSSQLICDDKTLNLLITKSRMDCAGLEILWMDKFSSIYSLEKIKEFLKKAKFFSFVSLCLGSIQGKKTEFEEFLRKENVYTEDICNFKMNDTLFTLNIDKFTE